MKKPSSKQAGLKDLETLVALKMHTERNKVNEVERWTQNLFVGPTQLVRIGPNFEHDQLPNRVWNKTGAQAERAKVRRQMFASEHRSPPRSSVAGAMFATEPLG